MNMKLINLLRSQALEFQIDFLENSTKFYRFKDGPLLAIYLRLYDTLIHKRLVFYLCEILAFNVNMIFWNWHAAKIRIRVHIRQIRTSNITQFKSENPWFNGIFLSISRYKTLTHYEIHLWNFTYMFCFRTLLYHFEDRSFNRSNSS